MRDPDRIPKVLEQLRKAWQPHPDLRLGQLLISAASFAGWPGNDLFYLEDDVLGAALERIAPKGDA